MAQRWSIWRVLFLFLVVVVPSFIFLGATTISPNLVNLIETSSGTFLARPDPEPNLSSGDDITRSFEVLAQIQPDRSVVITEKITQVFHSDRHGIERSIPISYDNGEDHVIRSMQVSTSEGTPDTTELIDMGGAVNVRIGDAEITINDAHTYELTYVIEDVVVVNGDKATIPLDAITDWRQHIDSLTYTVLGPDASIDARCYQGSIGSTEPCRKTTLTEDGAIFSSTNVEANNAFTIEMDYPASAFDATPTLTDRSQSVVGAVVAIILIFAAFLFAVAFNRRRYRAHLAMAIAGISKTFSGPMSIDLDGRLQRPLLPPPSEESTTLIPTSTEQEMPVEFVPPVNLDPASLLRIKDGPAVDINNMLAATLTDLAADGVVGLNRVNDEWIVSRIDQQPRMVKPYESTLLQGLLGDQNEAALSRQSTQLASVVKRYVDEVDAHLRELGLLTDSKLQVGKVARGVKSVGFGIFGLTVSVIALFGGLIGASSAALAVTLPVTAIVIAAMVGFFARLSQAGQISAYTSRGLGTAARARGFQRFFDESESAHAQAAERMGIMREYMGYAVAFNAVTTWIKAMPPAQLEQWNMSTSPLLFATLPDQSIWNRATTQAYTPATSSRSSGFSSGGGSSGGGGGFGGGGGGSW